jgi:hypothetical protein
MELNLQCAPGDAARGRFQTRAAVRVHRAVNREEDKEDADEEDVDAADAKVRYRPGARTRASASAAASFSSGSGSRESSRWFPRGWSPSTPPATRRSPEYAPFAGLAPRTSYERDVAAAAARAASAAAALAAAGDRSPSRRVDGDGLDGAARDVVREQQRMIAALQRQVDELREEIESASRGGSERGVGEWDDLEAAAERARDVAGGLRGAGFRDAEGGYGRSVGVPTGVPTARGTGSSGGRHRASPSKSPLRKALAFADERRDATTEEEAEMSTRVDSSEAASSAPKSPLRKALAFSRAEAAAEETNAGASASSDAEPESSEPPPPLSEKEARRLRKQQRKEAKREKKEKKKEKRRAGKGDADAEETPEAPEAPRDGRPSDSDPSASDPSASDPSACRAASIAARHAAAAAAATTRAEAREGYPPPPSGVPPDDPEPPHGAPRQPPRSPPKTPYVDSREDVEMHGERAADPLPGASVGYPGEPMLEFATTGTGEASPEASPEAENHDDDDDDEADALLCAPLMVDPETMDGEMAARAAAAARRDALARYAGAGAVPPAPTEGGETRASREELLRAAVRAGLDPMFPIIDDVGGDEDGLSAEEEDADILEKYADVRPLDDEEDEE